MTSVDRSRVVADDPAVGRLVSVPMVGGGTEPVALVENAFYWRASSPDETAMRIATWRGGKRESTSAMPGR